MSLSELVEDFRRAETASYEDETRRLNRIGETRLRNRQTATSQAINQARKASTPGSGGFLLFPAAFRTTARRTDPAILFAALRAGRVSRRADDVQLIVADHS